MVVAEGPEEKDVVQGRVVDTETGEGRGRVRVGPGGSTAVVDTPGEGSECRDVRTRLSQFVCPCV